MAKPLDINRVEYYHHEQGRLFVVGVYMVAMMR